MNDNRLKLLKELVAIQGNYQNENDMVDYINNFCKNIKGLEITADKVGNIIVTKQTNKDLKALPALACHMDTVHDISGNYSVVHHQDLLFTPPDCKAGIGGDDRNGIFVCLLALLELSDVKCFFFTSEEVGCIGSGDVDMREFDNCRFVIEPDRKDKNDLITTYMGQPTGGDSFFGMLKEYAEPIGYKHTEGVFTDVMTLLERGLPISVMNISCGYYNAHTRHEYISISELDRTTDLVFRLCAESQDVRYLNDYRSFDSYKDEPSKGTVTANRSSDEIYWWGNENTNESFDDDRCIDYADNDCGYCGDPLEKDDKIDTESGPLCGECVEELKDIDMCPAIISKET